MRRTVLVFRKVFAADGLTVAPSPAEGSTYGVAGWWRDRRVGPRVLNEYLKFAYYPALGRL